MQLRNQPISLVFHWVGHVWHRQDQLDVRGAFVMYRPGTAVLRALLTAATLRHLQMLFPYRDQLTLPDAKGQLSVAGPTFFRSCKAQAAAIDFASRLQAGHADQAGAALDSLGENCVVAYRAFEGGSRRAVGRRQTFIEY